MSEYQDYGYHSDTMTYNFNYMLQPLLGLLNKTNNTCIIDVGCGNGYLVNHLISLGYNAYGTDASAKGITIAKQTNPERFFVQDLSTGKLPEELRHLKFDTVIATEVIEHLYDPEDFIIFCKQVLEDKGEIILSTPYHGYLKNLALSIFNKWDSHLDPFWVGGHIKLWSKATLGRLVNKNGFTDVIFKGTGRISYFWKSMIIKARLN